MASIKVLRNPSSRIKVPTYFSLWFYIYLIYINQMTKSPYIKTDERLSEVIAAIQAMSIYKFYKLDFKTWADRITGEESQADHWEIVFKEHPEFFRLDAPKTKASLVVRRQHPKRYDVDREETITRDAFYGLSDAAKSRVSRTPLSPIEISTLISTAIELHGHALARRREARWGWGVFIAVVSAVASCIAAYVNIE